jgi:hypothetical protein
MEGTKRVDNIGFPTDGTTSYIDFGYGFTQKFVQQNSGSIQRCLSFASP